MNSKVAILLVISFVLKSTLNAGEVSKSDTAIIDGIKYSVTVDDQRWVEISAENPSRDAVEAEREFALLLGRQEPWPWFVDIKIDGIIFQQGGLERIWYKPQFYWSDAITKAEFDASSGGTYVLPKGRITVGFPVGSLLENAQKAVSEEDYKRIVTGDFDFSIRFKVGEGYILKTVHGN